MRYYAASNDAAAKARAESIAATVQQALESAGSPHAIAVRNLHDAFPKMPATTFEVWLPALPAPASRPNGPPGTG